MRGTKASFKFVRGCRIKWIQVCSIAIPGPSNQDTDTVYITLNQVKFPTCFFSSSSSTIVDHANSCCDVWVGDKGWGEGRTNSSVVPGELITSLWTGYGKTYSNPSWTFLSWFTCFVTPLAKLHWAFAVGLTFTGKILPRHLFRLPEASTFMKPILARRFPWPSTCSPYSVPWAFS